MILTCEQVRAADRRAIEEFEIPAAILMENAGRSLTESFVRFVATSDGSGDSLGEKKRVAILCGPGNNGGDGFVMARRLMMFGFRLTVVVCGGRDSYKDESAMNLGILRRMGDASMSLEFFDGTAPEAFSRLSALLANQHFLIDALLGTGTHGTPRPPLDGVIAAINRANKPVFSVDIPSGLDGDTGEALGESVVASQTCTLLAMKAGLVRPGAEKFTGRVEIGDIGIPPERLVSDFSST